MFSTLGQINHCNSVSRKFPLTTKCTYTHQLGQEPSGSQPHWQIRSWKDLIHCSCTPCRNRLCILRICEPQQQRVYVYVRPAEDLSLVPAIGQEILFRSPIVCAVEAELAQGVRGVFENQGRGIHWRHTVNCSIRRKVQSGLAVFPTSGPVNIHPQTRLGTGTGPAFLLVRNHRKKTRPSSASGPRTARCLVSRTSLALVLPVSARWNPGLSDRVLHPRFKRSLPQVHA